MSANLKRNDPCHCESGKKYKNCHGTKNSKNSYLWILWGVIIVLIIIFSFIPDSNPSPETNFVSKPYVPQSFNTSKKPDGEAPPGKIWSNEHGHWHDVNDVSNIRKSNQLNDEMKIEPSKTPPPGKIWSPDHGHWHDENEN